MLEPIKSTNIRLTRMYPRVIKHRHVVSEQSGRMNRRDKRSCSSSMLASTKNYQHYFTETHVPKQQCTLRVGSLIDEHMYPVPQFG